MPDATFVLAPPRQLRVAGLSFGVLGVRDSEEGPLARLGVFDPERGEPVSHVVRRGDQLDVAGRSVDVLDVVGGDHPHAQITVHWTDLQA